MKLTHVWANQTKIGLSSQIYQIKYYAPPEQLEINFIDTDIIQVQSLQGNVSFNLFGSEIY